MTAKKATIQQKEKSLEIVKGLDKTNIVNQFAQTKMVVIDALDSLTNKLIAGTDLLLEVDTAIAAKKEILKEINQIEVEADTLAKLLADQEETKKHWQRERADYDYNLNKQRDQELDQWELDKERRCREFDRELTEQAEELKKQVEDFKFKENEFDALKAESEEFPKKLAEALTVKEKEITRSLEQSFHFKSTIQQKDNDAAIALLKQTNDTQKARIVELEKSLEESRNLQKDAVTRVQSIAEKAIDGASKHQTVLMPTSESVGNSQKK